MLIVLPVLRVRAAIVVGSVLVARRTAVRLRYFKKRASPLRFIIPGGSAVKTSSWKTALGFC